MSRKNQAQAKELADALETKLDTATVLAEITLHNAALADCAEGAFLNSRRAGSLMQAQIFLSQSIFNDFCALMNLLEVPNG